MRAGERGWRCSSSPAGARYRARRAPPSARGLQPSIARVARLREELLESVAIARLQQLLHQPELRAVARELAEQRVAVGDADVAPHFRMARGDAREIAEA